MDWPGGAGVIADTQGTAAAAFPGDFEVFVLSRMERGHSWASIARDYQEATDYTVGVTPDSLLAWFGDLVKEDSG